MGVLYMFPSAEQIYDKVCELSSVSFIAEEIYEEEQRLSQGGASIYGAAWGMSPVSF